MLTGDAAELAERVKGRHDADDPKIDWLVVHLLDAHHPVVHLGHLAEHPALRPIGAAGGPIFIPGPGWGGGSGGSDWSGGGGGGGFSGGGGSFGGGGASGSW